MTESHDPARSNSQPSITNPQPSTIAGQTPIRRQVELSTTLDQLWRLVIDRGELQAWLSDDFDVELRVGAIGLATEGDRQRQVRIDAIEPLRRVSFTWWELGQPDLASRVELEVEGLGNEVSLLRITETLLPSASAPEIASALTAAEMAADAVAHWEVRVLSLWACTVAMALVQ